jgi:threonine/homoserine/homoserine lactone efflux protein
MQPFVQFLAVAAVAMLVPGPDTFVVLRTALADGPRAGSYAAAGSSAGNLLWGTASVVGVAGLLAASGSAFAALKLAGAAYLVVLGLQALGAAARGERLVDDVEQRAEASPAAAFRRGQVCDRRNVKVGRLWTALVPQFVTAGSSPLLPAALVAGMGLLVFGWLVAYAQLAGRMTRTLNRRGSSIALNGSVGALLVAFGARLGLAHP